MKQLIFFSLFLFGLMACSKDFPEPLPPAEEPSKTNSEDDYMLFGYFRGLCGGEECIEIFKLTDTELFELVDDPYPNTDDFPLSSDLTILDQSLYDQVAYLRDLVPQELIDAEESTFGIPDAYDQGGFVIEWNDDGQTGLWVMDTDSNAIPDYLHELATGIYEAVQIINN
ncbi:MAG: hypothetical protein AAGH79_03035 [Bacteroidota bacterium]